MDKSLHFFIAISALALALNSIGLALEMEVTTHEDYLNLGLEPEKNVSAFLRCSKPGKLVGAEEFMEFFEKLVNKCNDSPPDTTEFYNCITETIGMTNEDGTPQLKSIKIVVSRVISIDILNRLPKVKEKLHYCALNYVTNYGLGDEERNTAAKTYFECFGRSIEEQNNRKEKDLSKFLCAY